MGSIVYSMTTTKYLQYAIGLLAVATMVASEVLSWGLTAPMFALLGSLAGWLVAPRPSDLTPSE